jgi:ABC-type proline/glycine betaine transport system permease subunit
MAGNPEGNAVKKLESGMKLIEKSLTHICNIIGSTDKEQIFQKAMIYCYENILNGMEQALMTMQARKTAQSPLYVYNNHK